MATRVQLRRGTATQHLTFTGAPGEVTVDTTDWSIRVHDGVTPGGRMVRASRLRAGLLADRPAVAEVGDVYVAVDAKKLSIYL